MGEERGMEEEIAVGERERKKRREMGTERLGKRDCEKVREREINIETQKERENELILLMLV